MQLESQQFARKTAGIFKKKGAKDTEDSQTPFSLQQVSKHLTALSTPRDDIGYAS